MGEINSTSSILTSKFEFLFFVIFFLLFFFLYFFFILKSYYYTVISIICDVQNFVCGYCVVQQLSIEELDYIQL